MAAVFDDDKYYTPLNIARQGLELADLASAPLVCADTACGAGSLLTAAQDSLSAKYCVGIDNDRDAIVRLRRERPDWQLFIGDMLKRHRAPPIKFPDINGGVDLLVLNPPFSLGAKKGVSVNYSGNVVKCSVGMAHILRSMEIFRPRQGAVAVVPESLLYSETDREARMLLQQKYFIKGLLDLSIYTFKGARVNSAFVQIGEHNSRRKAVKKVAEGREAINVEIVRGGLQMHALTKRRSGVPVLHSTELKTLTSSGDLSLYPRTDVVLKGRVSGWLLLLPRVGVPGLSNFRLINFREEVQLSDCVIALKFKSQRDGVDAHSRIASDWRDLVNLYRGTGARYITIDRLEGWLGGLQLLAD